MNNLPKIAAAGVLFLLVVVPAVNAEAKAGSASATCSMSSATADAAGKDAGAVTQMFGTTTEQNQWQKEDAAHSHSAGDGGSTGTADGGGFHAHCNAHADATCANIPTAANLSVLGAIASSDASSSVPVAQHTGYAGVISYIPALSTFWFFGTVNHNGVVAPFAAPVDSSGTLTLTPSTAPAMAPVAVAAIDCLPVDVGLDDLTN